MVEKVNGGQPLQPQNQKAAEQVAQNAKTDNIPLVDKSKPRVQGRIMQDIGNGTTKIINQDGTVEFECDYAKGYDPSRPIVGDGVKVTILNEPKLGIMDSFKRWVNESDGGYLPNLRRGVVAMAGALAAAFGLEGLVPAATGKAVVSGVVATGVASCTPDKESSWHTTTTETFERPSTLKPQEFTDEEWAYFKENLLEIIINLRNESLGDQKNADGVGYKFQQNDDGTASVVIKNPDGTDSDLKFDLDINYIIQNQNTDDKTKFFTADLIMSALLKEGISEANVLKYIDIIGNNFELENVKYKFVDNEGKAGVSIADGAVNKASVNDNIVAKDVVDYINALNEDLSYNGIPYSYSLIGDDVVVNFSEGFTHKVGDEAQVKPDSPLGKMQHMLYDIGVLENEVNSLLTYADTNEGDYSGSGISFDLISRGDLKDITQGNPTVKIHIGCMQGVDVDIEGVLSANGNVIEIKDKAGNVMTLTPETPISIKGFQYGNGGAHVSYNGKAMYTIATDNFDGKRQTIIDHVDSDARTNFPPKDCKTFDCDVAKVSDDYYEEQNNKLNRIMDDAQKIFREKANNLTETVNAAVASLKGQESLGKAPNKVYEPQDIIINVETDADAVIKTRFGK